MREYLIRLPWPPKELSSNSTAKLRDKIRAKKSYRTACWGLAKQQGIACMPTAELHFTYSQPDNRSRDCQNMHHPMKHAIDGIALAMGCDDKDFACHFPARFEEQNVKGGCVLVHVKPGGDV